MLLAAIVVSASALTIYVAPLIPVIVAAVTKANAPSWLKAGLLVVLSAVSAAVTPVIQNGGSIHIDRAFLGAFVVSVVAAEVAHFLGKAAGVTGSTGLVATKISGGIGPSTTLP